MIRFIIIFSLTTFSTTFNYINANVIDYSASSKYGEIFSNKILTIKDIENYQKIFIEQKKCNFKKADKYIFEIKNKILMGHVLAQRYLHPDCYKSQFIELSSWMKMYNDLPQAKRIYRLAIRRMPEGYKRPPKPITAIGVNIEKQEVKIKPSKYQSKIKLNKSQRNEKYQLLVNIKSRVNKGWPTGALKLLNQSNTKNLLDEVEIDQQKELVAKGYFLANKNELAVKYAEEALGRSPNYVPFANWTAGLSSWRLKNYNKSSNFFSNFAIALKDDPWHNTAGSFWAARSYGELNDYKKINFWLLNASTNIETFYGQIANNILGLSNQIDWKKEKLNSDTEKIFINLPAGKRTMALIQIGRVLEAENEIVKLNNSLNQNIALISLGVANKFNMAYTQLKIANKLTRIEQEIPLRYFYPIPNWKPLDQYKTDKALIFAFIHQESTFNINAKSRKGAMGLMQIMPNTAKFISKNKKVKRGNSSILKDPLINIEVGEEYINYLLNLDLINGNLIYLAAAYNGGPGNLKKWLNETNFINDPLLFMESIPSRETRWFIEKILTNYWIYKDQFEEDSQSLLELSKGNDPIYYLKMNNIN